MGRSTGAGFRKGPNGVTLGLPPEQPSDDGAEEHLRLALKRSSELAPSVHG